MSITMHVTVTAKDGCFEEFYNLAKDELAFTRGSEGCQSIYTSSSKETNTLKFVEICVFVVDVEFANKVECNA